ncbi:MAG: hypothetical protein NT077_03700 [Candidatus Taylorbacteria bacterium]|nr:hypothetical protein [Candidatus Taylorbacteria bacterium]
MNQQEQQLTRDVMRRVRFIHTMHYLLTPSIIKGIVFLASLVSVLFLVSVVSIIDNMSHLPNVMAYFPYIFGAYLQTSFDVQSIIVLAIAALAWLAYDMVSRISNYGWSVQRIFAHS